MTAQEIRSAADSFLRAAFQHAMGSRPRRYQPGSDVLDGLCQLANEGVVQRGTADGHWRVVEGRRWLLNRRLDGRSVPLVQRDHVAMVVRTWTEARILASLLNWCDAVPPPRGAPGAAFVAGSTG